MADGGVHEPPVETQRRAGIGGFLVKFAGAIAILIVVALGLMWAAQSYVGKKLSPDPVTIANSSLQGLQEQNRSEEHTSELQSLMRLSYAVFCLNKKTHDSTPITNAHDQY